MPLETLPGEDQIVERIKAIAGLDVMQGDFTSDGYKPVVDGNFMFKPYALVKFNGGFPSYDNGIVGPDKDTQRTTFNVYVVAPDDRVARQMRDAIRVKMLTDFRPVDASFLRSATSYSFTDSDLGYNRYVHNIGFAYYYNLS